MQNFNNKALLLINCLLISFSINATVAINTPRLQENSANAAQISALHAELNALNTRLDVVSNQQAILHTIHQEFIRADNGLLARVQAYQTNAQLTINKLNGIYEPLLNQPLSLSSAERNALRVSINQLFVELSDLRKTRSKLNVALTQVNTLVNTVRDLDEYLIPEAPQIMSQYALSKAAAEKNIEDSLNVVNNTVYSNVMSAVATADNLISRLSVIKAADSPELSALLAQYNEIIRAERIAGGAYQDLFTQDQLVRESINDYYLYQAEARFSDFSALLTEKTQEINASALSSTSKTDFETRASQLHASLFNMLTSAQNHRRLTLASMYQDFETVIARCANNQVTESYKAEHNCSIVAAIGTINILDDRIGEEEHQLLEEMIIAVNKGPLGVSDE